MSDPDRRMPLPSEDEGNLVHEPQTGMTDDALVASEEGVPYDPPTDRVLSGPRIDEGGSDWAGSPPDDAAALAGDESISAPDGRPPHDDELRARVVTELRGSDVVAGDRIEVAVVGTTVYLRGEVESIDVGDEIAAIAADVPGVEEVVDETSVAGL